MPVVVVSCLRDLRGAQVSIFSTSSMAEASAQEPLLSNGGTLEHGLPKNNRPFWQSLAKWLLQSLMWVIFVTWAAIIFFFPSEFVKNLESKWLEITRESPYGVTGSVFLLFGAPPLIIAFLAFIYISAFSRDNLEKRNSRFPRFRLLTFPVLVDGPFGVVSAAECIGILLFSAYVLWAIIVYTIESQRSISKFPWLPSKEKSYLMLDLMGLRLGTIGLFCMVFLFLPVARGSILLRLIDIPFEHATRYHVWLGHLTMAIFTLHGLFFVISWSLQGKLLDELIKWQDIGVANLPGVISLLAGLIMWMTSLRFVRKNHFELFFYTHQLYVVFVVFLALHVGDFIFSITAGGIFLFMLDRFLRFWQSRTKVNIISAACRPCGTVELVLSKPANLRYNALSFVFLQVRELSWLQWHPFSVSSSPLDGSNHLTILIKVLGEWTEKLRDSILNFEEKFQKDSQIQPSTLTASVEGPYGHELPYHLLMYENLILVAGGIGISPFLAILSDILHRVTEGKPCLPRNVLVVWAVKKSKELSLLSAIGRQNIYPSFSDKLNLNMQAYVTQESEPQLEEGKLCEHLTSSFSVSNGSPMSCLVGTGHNVWAGIYVVVSTIGFIVSFGFLEVYYINPFGIHAWWYRGLLFTLSMVVGIAIFGGIVVVFWHQWERRTSSQDKVVIPNDEKPKLEQHDESQIDIETSRTNLAKLLATQYGCRPDFEAIFGSFANQVGHADVGVIVCGPPGLQSSVARECRSQNIRGRRIQPVFHFHSHSFDL